MSARKDVMWLMRRLAVMSPREVAHRGKTVLQSAYEGLHRRLTGRWPGLEMAGHARFGFMVSASRQLFVPPVDLASLPAVELLAGRIPVFRHWATWHPGAEFWHTDPLTGATWPFGHGSRPEHRPGNPVGDARVIWELNRLQHLVSLALIAGAQPEQRVKAAGLISQQLESWLAANPFPWGINHRSAMEEALRAIAVLHAYDLVRDSVADSTRHAVANLLCTHGWHIERRLSLYSSAGNHTIAEAVSLLYLGLMLAEHHRAPEWVRLARNLLGTEGARQVRDDGGPLEQATWYLLFIADLMGLAQLLLAHVGADPIPEMDAAVERARDFLGTLAGSADRLPRIGDADDGYALSPALQLSFNSHRPGPVQRTFPSTGISVVSFDGHDQLLFLHKDLGMPPNYGHGHSDILSVLFRWKDQDVLLDLGTYMYGGDPSLRSYFRSATAHNTVSISHRDQAKQVGPFLWQGAPTCTVVDRITQPSLVAVVAAHDGFRELNIIHWRGVYYRRDTCLAIWDVLSGPVQSLKALAHWHFGAAVSKGHHRDLALSLSNSSTIRMTHSTSGEGGRMRANVDLDIDCLSRASSHYGNLSTCHSVATQIPASHSGDQLTVFWLDEDNNVDDALDEWREKCRDLCRTDKRGG